MTGGVKALGAAFAAIGIGLIIAAFMKLKEAFTSNMVVARELEARSTALSAQFAVLTDEVTKFIFGMDSAFSEEREKGVEGFFNRMLNKIMFKWENAFGYIENTAKGVWARLKGDTEEATKFFGQAAISAAEFFTGLDMQKWGEVTKNMKEEGSAADQLTRALQKVRDEEMELLIVRAEANRIIAESRLLAEDDTKSNEERLIALQAAVAEEQRVAILEIETQKKKVAALQEFVDMSISSEEEELELRQEKARLIELETGSILRQKRVAAEVGVFTAKVEKERTDAQKEELALIAQKEEAQKRGLEFTEEMTSKEIALLIKKADKEIEIEKKLQVTKRKIIADALGSVSALLGKETKAGKALAVGQALINTYSAAAAALAPPPTGAGPIFGPIAAAGAIAAGMANVKSIIATQLPGAESGSISGAEPATPIGSNLIPNIESISPPDLGETPPIQAFVVENDISNAQALQEELEIQATL